jgi:hypothetical protein
MTVTTKSDPAKGYYVYKRAGNNHPFVTILRAEGLGANSWVVSVQINVGERYIDSYYNTVEKSMTRAKQIVSLLKKKYPGVYKLV